MSIIVQEEILRGRRWGDSAFSSSGDGLKSVLGVSRQIITAMVWNGVYRVVEAMKEWRKKQEHWRLRVCSWSIWNARDEGSKVYLDPPKSVRCS